MYKNGKNVNYINEAIKFNFKNKENQSKTKDEKEIILIGRFNNLRIDVNEKNKILALWLTNQESINQNLPKDIENEIEKYKEQKYRICIYQSGNEDIKNNLLNLILNNA